mgnify:CR=1 FL=1
MNKMAAKKTTKVVKKSQVNKIRELNDADILANARQIAENPVNVPNSRIRLAPHICAIILSSCPWISPESILA